MKVEKRSKKIQDFNKGKIVTSITNASDEVNKPLNESDIDIVTNAVYQEIIKNNNEVVTSEYIFQAIYNELKNMGFKDVAESYKQGTNRH